MNIKKVEDKTKNKIDYYNTINSTHLKAKQIASNIDANKKIIIAKTQTNAIGSKGRSWYTGNNSNIAMTIILKPDCKVKELDGLTLKIANVIKKAIYNLYGYKLEIKEPNDLMLNGKKICGILTEVNTIGEKINYLLISIGFNVNEQEFSKETRKIATSLKLEYGKDYEREEIIIEIINQLKKEIEI